MSNIAIVDGDVLAYMSCPPRLQVHGGHYQVSKETKPSDIIFTPEDDAKYLEICWKNFKIKLNDIIELCWADFALCGVKDEFYPDFRSVMYPDYKITASRNPAKKNKAVPEIRLRAISEGLAIPASNREADDLMRIWSEEARKAGDTYTVCSIDKDLKCIPGRHYLMNKDTFFEISEEDAHRFHYEQLLKGDPTDKVPGIPKVGDVGAHAIISEFETEEGMRECVLSMYKNSYGEYWREYLLSNGKMLYLQKHPNDYFSLAGWDLT